MIIFFELNIERKRNKYKKIAFYDIHNFLITHVKYQIVSNSS